MLRRLELLQRFGRTAIWDGGFPTARYNFPKPQQLQNRTLPIRRTFSTPPSRPCTARRPVSRSPRTVGTRGGRQTRHNSNKPAVEAENATPPQSKSMSQRMKDMSRKYGWSVVGIYLSLSALDFPFCFLAVRLFGTERIGQAEHAVVDGFWKLVERFAPSLKERRERNEAEALTQEVPEETAARESGSVVAYTEAVHENASIWTQLLLAYGVHKSLIFIRIPITLAVTPRIVKVLRSWGWKIGKNVP